MRTNKYKKFNNYEDLNQEGMEALLKSMKNYNPKKGNFFYWAHRYIDTRISRSANLHTTIRYPLKIAKENIPHKESIMPILIEEIHCPDKELEKIQAINIIKSSLPLLSDEQNNVISLAYGINMDKPYSINKICKELHISRSSCVKLIHSAISVIKHNVII
jgi:RNA polymerase sigma factor (sigma-70 family)